MPKETKLSIAEKIEIAKIVYAGERSAHSFNPVEEFKKLCKAIIEDKSPV